MEWWNHGIMVKKLITSVFGSKFLGSIVEVASNYQRNNLQMLAVCHSLGTIDVFSMHGLFIPCTVLFFNQMEHECTHYSDCERSELSSNLSLNFCFGCKAYLP